MRTGVHMQMVRERYERMSDEELVRTLTQDAVGLTPEAIEIVKAEMEKRKLPLTAEILRGVEAQNREYSLEEIDAYCDVICNLGCPRCGDNTFRLNGTLTAEVISFVFFTQYKKYLKIACGNCLHQYNNSALTKTALLGWWGIPWGIIYSIRALHLNWTSKQNNHNAAHNESLRNFVLQHIGAIETYREDELALQQLLQRQNQIE